MQRSEMSPGEAVAIFLNIKQSKRSIADKKKALRIVTDMPTHNGISKKEILNALDWLLSVSEGNGDCGTAE